jgi:hypothetical protein
LGFQYICIVKAVRTLLIAVLFAFPILGDAADDRPISNWVWELPGERESFTGLLTDDDFRRVVRELENRRGADFLDFKSRLPGPIGQGALYPSGRIIEPPRNSQSIEAAEILNSLRMDRYRQDCEKLKHNEMHGTPALYPTQIPWLGSP